jgi:hypothetical protein
MTSKVVGLRLICSGPKPTEDGLQSRCQTVAKPESRVGGWYPCQGVTWLFLEQIETLDSQTEDNRSEVDSGGQRRDYHSPSFLTQCANDST